MIASALCSRAVPLTRSILATLHEKGFSHRMSATGPFDFSAAMSRLCSDIVARVDEFSHVRVDQMAVTFAQARRRVPHGLQAKLTPMRFENGALVTRRAGRTWTVERLFHGNREMLYILTFYLPRFLDHSYREKLITVFHELYHVSPRFNGDIRRMSGRCHVHSRSQREYDRLMEEFVDGYLSLDPPESVCAFLKKKYRALCAQHGSVVGLRVPVPKLVPLPHSKSA
jgi:predicted metallopeptidase